MAGVEKGEPGLYVGFHESRDELIAKARKFNLDLQGAIDNGLITLLNFAPVQVEPDIIAAQLRQNVEQHNIRRFVCEGYSEIEHACTLEGRSPDFMAALVNYLKQYDITALYTHEIQTIVGPELDLANTPFTKIAENLILMRHVEYRNRLSRIISLLKMRDSNFDQTIREFTIEDDKGITMLQPIEGSGVITGLARIKDSD